MIKTVCDACGRTISGEQNRRYRLLYKDDDYGEYHNFDLCKSCYTQLWNFVKHSLGNESRWGEPYEWTGEDKVD